MKEKININILKKIATNIGCTSIDFSKNFERSWNEKIPKMLFTWERKENLSSVARNFSSNECVIIKSLINSVIINLSTNKTLSNMFFHISLLPIQITAPILQLTFQERPCEVHFTKLPNPWCENLTNTMKSISLRNVLQKILKEKCWWIQ